MKILIFTEGTILMHKTAIGHSRDEIVKQVEDEDESIYDYKSYVPIGDAVKKIHSWKTDGAELFYLTSCIKPEEIKDIQNVLKKYNFPEATLLFRKQNEDYKDIVEKLIPDVLIEDDCESIGGINEMTITHIKPLIKKQIKSISIKEFGGIDHLPDNLNDLVNY